MKEQLIHYDGQLKNGNEFSVVGQPVNGTAERISKNITKIGQDAALVIPKHNVIAVFDGAGGATDIGSPEEAALTGADAIETYFKTGRDDLLESVEFARQAIAHNPVAGICVAALTRITDRGIESVAAGDSGAMLFTPSAKTLDVIAEQQISNYEPANYLGRLLPRVTPSASDFYKSTVTNRSTKQELYVMSDGVLGNWEYGDDLQDFHFSAAHSEYQLLRDARNTQPNFAEDIQQELTSQKAKDLAARQIQDNTSLTKAGEVSSLELLDPTKFNPEQFDWDIWCEIVLPYIESQAVPRSSIGRLAICESLIKRPIAWPFERTANDDATVVMIDLPAES